MNVIKLILVLVFSVGYQFSYARGHEELLSADVQAAMHASVINPIEPHLVFADQDKAQAWLNDMSVRLKRWVPDDFMRKRLLTRIQYEAVRAGLDPQIVLSLITVESKFNKYAISYAGAEGIMQVMPFWLREIGNGNQSLLDVDTNIRFGCTILRYYLQVEHGNLQRALARYNGSIGQTWYPDRVMAAYNRYWEPATVMTITKAGQVKYINYASNI